MGGQETKAGREDRGFMPSAHIYKWTESLYKVCLSSLSIYLYAVIVGFIFVLVLRVVWAGPPGVTWDSSSCLGAPPSPSILHASSFETLSVQSCLGLSDGNVYVKVKKIKKQTVLPQRGQVSRGLWEATGSDSPGEPGSTASLVTGRRHCGLKALAQVHNIVSVERGRL